MQTENITFLVERKHSFMTSLDFFLLCTVPCSERSDWYGDLKELQIRFEKLKKNEKKKNSVSGSSQKLAEEIERLLGNLLQLVRNL